MARKLHTPTDEAFADRTTLIPEEVNLAHLLKLARERAEQRQVFTLENKDLRVEIYLKS